MILLVFPGVREVGRYLHCGRIMPQFIRKIFGQLQVFLLRNDASFM
jgi:hypothetical protein